MTLGPRDRKVGVNVPAKRGRPSVKLLTAIGRDTTKMCISMERREYSNCTVLVSYMVSTRCVTFDRL